MSRISAEKRAEIVAAYLENDGATYKEIGERFGLTRERVRQIKEKAIRRLRHNTKSKMLKTYLGQ
jgi:RNA polymerase primary sigma factor